MRVFVSYKSEDCTVAREVAEILISTGVSVWLAEYDVLPSQYDEFERDIHASLDKAVRGCTHALVFTNNRWSESDYCRTEMESISAAIPAERIIEVRMPHEELPHRAYPVLEHGSTLDYEQDPTATVESVLRLLDVDTALVRVAFPPAKSVLRLWRLGLALNPGSFRPRIEESKRATNGHASPAVLLETEMNGQMVQLIIVLKVFDTVLRSLQISEEGASADREVYRGYRRYAQEWEGDNPFDVRGLHLFFWNGRSQLALTYVMPGGDYDHLQGSWERRYILSPRGSTPAERGEIHFIFYAPDLKGTPEEQVREFAALCPIFDQLMQSVQYQPVTAGDDFVNGAPLVLTRLLYLAVCGWGIYALASRPNSADWLILLVMAAGTIYTELTVVLYSSVYRQIVWTATGTSAAEDSLGDPYSRITNHLFYEITGYPVLLAMQYFTDFILTLGASKGTLRFPGPGLAWFVAIWLLLISYGYEHIGLSWSAALGFFLAFIVSLIVVLRSVCHRIHAVNWRDLDLR